MSMSITQPTRAEMHDEVVCTHRDLLLVGGLSDDRATMLRKHTHLLAPILTMWSRDDPVEARNACVQDNRGQEDMADLLTMAKNCFPEESTATWDVTSSIPSHAEKWRQCVTSAWNMRTSMILRQPNRYLGPGDYFQICNNVLGVRAMLQSKGYKTNFTVLNPKDEVESILSVINVLTKWWDEPDPQKAYNNLDQTESSKQVRDRLIKKTKDFYVDNDLATSRDYWENIADSSEKADHVRDAVTKTWQGKVDQHFPIRWCE